MFNVQNQQISDSGKNVSSLLDIEQAIFQKECSSNIEQPSVEPAVSRQQNR